jgi:hypothetical protein
MPFFYFVMFLQKKKDADEKQMVVTNKRLFVDKMLPVVEMFRLAPVLAPANPENERELTMHKNFASMFNCVISVIEKYGYKDLIDALDKKLASRESAKDGEEKSIVGENFGIDDLSLMTEKVAKSEDLDSESTEI